MLHVTEQFPGACCLHEKELKDLTWLHGQGNISCLVTRGLEPVVDAWLKDRSKHTMPKDTTCVFDAEFAELAQLLQHETTCFDLEKR